MHLFFSNLACVIVSTRLHNFEVVTTDKHNGAIQIPERKHREQNLDFDFNSLMSKKDHISTEHIY